MGSASGINQAYLELKFGECVSHYVSDSQLKFEHKNPRIKGVIVSMPLTIPRKGGERLVSPMPHHGTTLMGPGVACLHHEGMKETKIERGTNLAD